MYIPIYTPEEIEVNSFKDTIISKLENNRNDEIVAEFKRLSKIEKPSSVDRRKIEYAKRIRETFKDHINF